MIIGTEKVSKEIYSWKKGQRKVRPRPGRYFMERKGGERQDSSRRYKKSEAAGVPLIELR